MDWISLLSNNSVPYVTRGPNTKRGEISIRCPFCGEDDPSEHMGISLSTDNWGCHRDASHRGHSPIRLITAILGCSSYQARLIVSQYGVTDPDRYEDNSPNTAPVRAQIITLPSEFEVIRSTGLTAKFWKYLLKRGFNDPHRCIDRYQLSCALTGRWKDRIIIPFYEGASLIGWTGRALIVPVSAPRYLSSSEAVKRTIFNFNNLLAGGDTLYVTEGPFDALKLDYYGAPATCIFGVSITVDQAALIREIGRGFKRVVLMLDAEASQQAFQMLDWLGPNVEIGVLPFGVKDPGDLTEEQVSCLSL